ncbi:MAG: hypothetical protein P8Y70_20970 [Candidatus Lokiarchaeota archaeon]
MKKIHILIMSFILLGLASGFITPLCFQRNTNQSNQSNVEVELIKASSTETAHARLTVKWNYWGTYYTIFKVDIDITGYTQWWGAYQIYYFDHWDNNPYDDWTYTYYTVGGVHEWGLEYLGTSPDWRSPDVTLTPTYFQGRCVSLTYTFEGHSDQFCLKMPVFGAWVEYTLRLVLNSDGSYSAHLDSWAQGNAYYFQKIVS